VSDEREWREWHDRRRRRRTAIIVVLLVALAFAVGKGWVAVADDGCSYDEATRDSVCP
jgi:hypothetical protein